MKYLKAALLCAVCMGILAFACYAPAGQEDLRDGDGISLYDIKDDYVIAELTEGQQDLARAVWTAIREGALGTVSVGMFELDEADARMVMNAVDLNYYPFGGGPAIWMTPALAVRDGKEVHEFFVDVTKSREAIGLNERFMELCRKISRPYIKAGMSRRQILLELEKAVSDHEIGRAHV